MYDYIAQNDDELAFSKGQIINVLNKEDPDWWKGEVNGQVGLFPSNYVKLTTDMDPSQQCKWLFSHSSCLHSTLRHAALLIFCCVLQNLELGHYYCLTLFEDLLYCKPKHVLVFSSIPLVACYLYHFCTMLLHAWLIFLAWILLIVLFCLCVVFLLFLGIICCPSPTQAWKSSKRPTIPYHCPEGWWEMQPWSCDFHHDHLLPSE